jgi:hypothetical protein
MDLKKTSEDENWFDHFVLAQLNMRFQLPDVFIPCKPNNSTMDCRRIGFEEVNSLIWLVRKDLT